MTYRDPAGERNRDVTTEAPLPVRAYVRNALFRGLARTRRTPETNTNVPQCFAIEDQARSPVLVAVRRRIVSMDPTAVLTTSKLEVCVSRRAGSGVRVIVRESVTQPTEGRIACPPPSAIAAFPGRTPSCSSWTTSPA